MAAEAQAAAYLVSALLIGAIIAMWDVARQKGECAECSHCRDGKALRDRKEVERRKTEAHRMWHGMHRFRVPEECPYCKESGGVPPPSGSHKEE